MGKEINYDNPDLDIKSSTVLNAYRNFILKNYNCLKNIDEIDEYECPKLNFERERKMP